MSEPIILTSEDAALNHLHFRPYRNKMVRRVTPFLPRHTEPQTKDITTPWGTVITATPGDFLISELSNPEDVWPIAADIFEQS